MHPAVAHAGRDPTRRRGASPRHLLRPALCPSLLEAGMLAARAATVPAVDRWQGSPYASCPRTLSGLPGSPTDPSERRANTQHEGPPTHRWLDGCDNLTLIRDERDPRREAIDAFEAPLELEENEAAHHQVGQQHPPHGPEAALDAAWRTTNYPTRTFPVPTPAFPTLPHLLRFAGSQPQLGRTATAWANSRRPLARKLTSDPPQVCAMGIRFLSHCQRGEHADQPSTR